MAEPQVPTATTAPNTTNSSTARNSIDTVADQETRRENARQNNPNGFARTNSGIDVAVAEEQFATLKRELTGISQASRQLSREQSRASKHKGGEKDIENGPSESEGEQFDLESTLHGNHAAEEESGIRPKHIGVIWDGLTVSGTGGVTNFVKVFPDAFVSFFNVIETGMNLFGVGKKGKEVKILDDFRGVTKPGEMVLVLGRPGSGCTTFLKVIANQRFGYTGVDGEVSYGPISSKEFSDGYRGEAVYNQEDDIHHPTLTVGQTLGFALDTKTPGKRPLGMSKGEFKDRVVTTLLKMFNIEHTRNTIVGNQFVRGVSGGERKRVSIAEMMCTSGTVCAWDNSTRGLDASTALDYAKSLRVMTNIYKCTTFVSLYQASENIYRQFDKVLVIDDGRQVYYGPAKEARAYFEGLGFKEKPRQTSPDFLTGCTDEFEREYAEGRSADNAPSSPESLAKAFNESKIATGLNEEMAEYRKSIAEDVQRHEDFKVAVSEGKRKGTSKNSVFTIPYYMQIYVLMKRQYLIKWQDKFSLVVAWVTSFTIAIVLGTVWLNLPKTSAGAFTRGGLLFIALLFNAFTAFAELASTMMGRPIVNKHKAYTFHRPSALWIAQILVDTAFASAQIFVFSVIVYFMCGLVRDAGAFFTFFIVIVAGYLAMTLFFRTVGCLCPDFDYAIKFAATIITCFVITSGYLIQYQSEKVWLRWIFWINALGLGFSALMENEFGRLDLTCTAESLVPSGPSYTDIAHQVCTIAGSVSGTDRVSGSAYISEGFAYNVGDLWRNFGIIIALIVAFLISNATLGEWLTFGEGGNAAKIFQKPNKERDELNLALAAKKDARRSAKGNEAESSDININSKAVLTWEGLNYDVPTPSGELRLLNNIYGYVRPGELTALMGASGKCCLFFRLFCSRMGIGSKTCTNLSRCRQNHTPRCPRFKKEHRCYLWRRSRRWT